MVLKRSAMAQICHCEWILIILTCPVLMTTQPLQLKEDMHRVVRSPTLPDIHELLAKSIHNRTPSCHQCALHCVRDVNCTATVYKDQNICCLYTTPFLYVSTNQSGDSNIVYTESIHGDILREIPMPVGRDIPGGLESGMKFTVIGWVKPNPELFLFEFIRKDVNDYPFHCSFRFNRTGDHRVILRNDFQNGVWGTQVKGGTDFPFAAGNAFKLTIDVLDDKLSVSVNNQHLFDFEHRHLPLSEIDHFAIKFDVIPTEIRIE